MAESYDLFFYAGRGANALEAGRALARSASAGSPAQAPTSASLSPGRLEQLAGDVAAAVPDTEQAAAEEAPPGSQLLLWPEFPHGQLELQSSHARFGIRGTSVRGGSVLANWHARLVGAAPLLTQAGFDTIYDARLDRVIALPEDWPELNLNWWTFYCGPPRPPRPPGKIRRLFGAQDPPPFVPVPVTWRVVVFSADGASDPLARGRELAAAERSSRPGQGQPDGAGRITRALEALEEHFPSHIEAMGSPQDGYVTAANLDMDTAFDLTPVRIEIRTYGLTYFAPKRGGILFRDAAQAIVSAGDFDTVYDPQLDRLVRFPADTDAVSAAWVKAYEREVARVTA